MGMMSGANWKKVSENSKKFYKQIVHNLTFEFEGTFMRNLTVLGFSKYFGGVLEDE